MSSISRPSPPRAGSYVLVPSSAPLDDSPAIPDPVQRVSGSRPRLFFLVPLVAALDVAVTLTLGILVLRQQAKHDGSDKKPSNDLLPHDPVMISSTDQTDSPHLDKAAWERRKIVILVIAFSIARAFAFAMVGISKRIRQLGVTVAAISILSALFYISVANLLFQARSKPDTLSSPPFSWSQLVKPDEWHWPDAFRHFEPTMPILVGAQMAFTLFEWILYISIVGVKIPPGGNRAEAKRWVRNLADDPYFQRGVDAHSLYASEDGRDAVRGEEQDQEEDFAADSRDVEDPDEPDGAELEQAQALLSSSISNLSPKGQADGSDQPLLGASPSTPRGYGSTLTEPRTPQGPSHAGAQLQGSVKSARSPAAAAPASARGMSRSSSARSDLYSKSPGAAELGAAARHSEVIEDDDDDDDDRAEEGDEEAEGSDPDDIIDITPDRAVARKEARLRLARAALPERRASGGTLSTLSIFGGGGGGGSGSGDGLPNRTGGGARGPNVFSNEAGSPLGRSRGEDEAPAALLSVATSSNTAADTSIQSSASMTQPSSSSTHTTSTRASSLKDRKFKLPKWMKPNSKNRKK